MVGEQKLNNPKKAPEGGLQRGVNKLARASWKFHFYKLQDLDNYVDYMTDTNLYSLENTTRHSTITKFNFFVPAVLHTGKVLVDKNFTRYHIGFKLGQFTKNRKPYYFRSKKKKNVTKKNHLPQPTPNVTSRC